MVQIPNTSFVLSGAFSDDQFGPVSDRLTEEIIWWQADQKTSQSTTTRRILSYSVSQRPDIISAAVLMKLIIPMVIFHRTGNY